MPPKRVLKRRPDEDDRSPARGAKRPGKNKREQTYDTYDEAMDGGVEMEEKGERYRDGEKGKSTVHPFDLFFLLTPTAIVQLNISIELYRLSMSLTDSTLLQMDAGYNCSQALTDLADMLEATEGDVRIDEVRRLREEAKDMLGKVLQGQEEYLQLTTEAVDVEAVEEAAIDEDKDDGGMDVDDPPDDQEGTTTNETHLPTPSSLVGTALAIIELHLSLWESVIPLRTPDEAEQSAVRSALDRAGSFIPPGRQAELDLAEIKVLLTMDSIVWDLFKAEARIGTGVEKSLEGAVAALEALLASLDVHTPDEQTVRADILTTLAETHSTIAYRMLSLTPQLPPGPSPLAQQAWLHFSEAVTHLTTALDLPSNGFTPKLFKPSVLLSLSKASFSRAKLADINETAKRNLEQLIGNATTYASRAVELLGIDSSKLGDPAGWDAELLIRDLILHRSRISSFGPKSPEIRDQPDRHAQRLAGLVSGLKAYGAGERRMTRFDVERWIGEIEEEGGMSEEERRCWKEVADSLGD